MNVTSASTSAVSNTGSSSSSAKTSSSKSSSTSFDDELKNASKTEEAKETENSPEADAENKAEQASKDEKASKQDDTNDKKDDKNQDSKTLKGEVSQNDLLNTEELLAQNIQAMFNNGKNIANLQNQYQRLNIANIDELSRTLSAQVDYTSINMDMNDAQFFSNLVQNTDMSMKSVAAEIQNLAQSDTQQAQKTANVSATLMNALHEGLKTNQPFRINFDKDISVIIKINKDGSIAANFIPGDKAVEEYLKMNISTLRQRFDEQELSYSDLSYSRSRRDQEQENKRKNKENSHE